MGNISVEYFQLKKKYIYIYINISIIGIAVKLKNKWWNLLGKTLLNVKHSKGEFIHD